MKKIIMTVLAVMTALSLTACGQPKAADGGDSVVETGEPIQQEMISIASLDGSGREISLEVPYNPQRIAVLDMAALDIIDNLGMGERVVGTADTSIDYLSAYVENEQIKNLGTIKEADLEAVMSCEPDVIFIGGRLSASYDALSEIAPVVYLSVDSEIGVVESVKENAQRIASLFGLEDTVLEKTEVFTQRLAKLQEFAEEKTALVGMTTSGSFNLLGNEGRCSVIGVEIGFYNLAAADATSTHGNESSFETVVQMNPDYIFVMDRDSAIAAEGAKLAQEIMENELVMETKAYQEGGIVYLENPAVWYTVEGGITALDVMLSDLEKGLGLE